MVLMQVRPNGCELSGQGSLHHIQFRIPAPACPFATGAESPVRSSELLGRCSMQPTSNQAHDLSIQSLKIGRAEIMKDGGELPFRGSSLTLCAPIAQHGAFN